MNWNPAEFHDNYSRMPIDEAERQVWDGLTPGQRKVYGEWRTMNKFAEVCGLGIDPKTVESRNPPEPDCLCEISAKKHYFELGEVTDQDLAQQAGIAAKNKQENFSGPYSQLEPLMRIFTQKCAKSYLANGLPVHLLLHYAVGHHVPHAVLVQGEIGKRKTDIVSQLRQSAFRSVWIYDAWDNRVITHVQQ